MKKKRPTAMERTLYARCKEDYTNWWHASKTAITLAQIVLKERNEYVELEAEVARLKEELAACRGF